MVDAEKKGEVIRCRECGAPLARWGNGVLYMMKPHKGEMIEVAVEIKHTAGGVVAVRCEKHKRLTPHYFITVRATQKLTRTAEGYKLEVFY